MSASIPPVRLDWLSANQPTQDMTPDRYQMNNLASSGNGTTLTGIDAPLGKLRPRLNALVLVLKSCTKDDCRNPWGALHPQGDVKTLADALASRYDDFYSNQPKVNFDECIPAFELDNERPLKADPFPGAVAMQILGTESG